MQLTYRLPKLPDLPTLSEKAKRRLQAVEFSFRHVVPLAFDAFQVSRSALHRWRQHYQPRNPESLEPRSRAHWRARSVSWRREDEQLILRLRQQHPCWGNRKLLPFLWPQVSTLFEGTVDRIRLEEKSGGAAVTGLALRRMSDSAAHSLT